MTVKTSNTWIWVAVLGRMNGAPLSFVFSATAPCVRLISEKPSILFRARGGERTLAAVVCFTWEEIVKDEIIILPELGPYFLPVNQIGRGVSGGMKGKGRPEQVRESVTEYLKYPVSLFN